ncbi:TasA family protein [Bacillus sp. DTU_2020_1000418_1_SI_GHA_SEK_038]|uniref:TasA family protein n=1 Tax=Bacillus sp. DTU_2020_1000418_1_SI_GHA_SEK_038 TaxID=3077585 RepID=UPI0028ED462E|nr:TasA family protein [Bacillus sp. DTU_2020_1000418_1_SI_GHA_SEK_038]WNS76387.1 TasA family protein [Bacillus sp. DTU_2020_1000418_1_SI_GHA_SEK_038]
MTIKKKLTLGIASAALGLSLVGGGTFAAFNDVETMNNTLKSGVLDLKVDPSVIFNVSKLKPGDYMLRDFKIENIGTLDIEKVLMHTSIEVKDREGNIVDSDFASQFIINFLTSDLQPIITPWDNVSLQDLKGLTDNGKSPDITTYLKQGLIVPLKPDLPVGDTDHIVVMITFKNDDKKDNETGLYFQNEYQGLDMKLTLNLEATQYSGTERENNYQSQETPDAITITEVKIIKNEWKWQNEKQGYKLSAQVEFSFSDGNTIKSNTANINNANPAGESITFTQKYKNNDYSITLDIPFN